MQTSFPSKWFYFFIVLFFLSISLTDSKGGRGRGGGGARGRISFGGFKSAARLSKPSSFGRGSPIGGQRSGGFRSPSSNNLKKNAISFGAGALGGVAAYLLMHSMASSYRLRPNQYEPGYGTGATCVNNKNFNGTKFGQFRCPLNGFPIEAKYCCGDDDKQFCCKPVSNGSSFRGIHLALLLLAALIVLGGVLAWKRGRKRRSQLMMVPTEPQRNDPSEQIEPLYPPPTSTGHPFVSNESPSRTENPNVHVVVNPYAQSQQISNNPYLAEEASPPAYEEAMRNYENTASTMKESK